jgi:hypothetical protein
MSDRFASRLTILLFAPVSVIRLQRHRSRGTIEDGKSLLYGAEPMPIHTWYKTDAGLFHHFHQSWIVNLASALNSGILPPDYMALAEQVAGGPIPDLLTLQRPGRVGEPPAGDGNGGIRLTSAPPRTTFVSRAEIDVYALKADRLAIRHRLGDLIAVVEIVSPGNKSSKAAIRTFVDKSVQFLRHGVHMLIVDLFPPTPRDPAGLHKLIWDEILEEPFALPLDKPLTLAAYSAGDVKVACVEPVAVGDVLPEMPLYLEPERYIPAPLESTYLITWNACPTALKEAVIEDAAR